MIAEDKVAQAKLINWACKCMDDWREKFGTDPELRALVPSREWPFGFTDFHVVRVDSNSEFILLREGSSQ